MTTQNFVTLPRVVVERACEYLLSIEHHMMTTHSNKTWDAHRLASRELSAALTEQVQPAQGEQTSGDYALGYAEGFNDACKPSNAELVPLSDAQICAIEREVALSMLNNHATDAIAFARAIEAEITKGQQ